VTQKAKPIVKQKSLKFEKILLKYRQKYIFSIGAFFLYFFTPMGVTVTGLINGNNGRCILLNKRY
jgi:hypothetical protein